MASPFLIDHPSPPLPFSAKKPRSPQSGSSVEAFPEFSSSPTVKSSPASNHRSNAHTHLEVPGTQTQAQRPNRPFRTPSQRLPPTALLPSGRNASHNDLSTPGVDHRHDRDEQPHQRLPRAMPAPSLAGPSIRPTSSIAPGLTRGSTANIARPQPNAEELKSESLWADMQRTLADVELSAMSSSHLFNAPHSQALEKLRETQLALAQAWARSEADETGGQGSEDEYLVSESEDGMQAGSLVLHGPGPSKGTNSKAGKETGSKPVDRRNRQGSVSSQTGKDLEEETEKDIKLARKRREANDHYFSQVNRGVLDVVARLDEVASAMRTVEKESRAVWDEMDASGSSSTSVLDGNGDADDSDKAGPALMRELTKVTTTTGTTGTGSGTEATDSTLSPVTPKRSRMSKVESPKEAKKNGKEKGR